MRILITPMDWGLGHASRCVPLIRELIRQGAEVVMASSGPALELLRKYFPQLSAETLPAYRIRYPSDNMFFNILLQLPHINYTIRAERIRVEQLVHRYKIDCIISDNRFGCSSPQTYNIFITHQLSIKTPKSGNFIGGNKIVNKWNHYRIQQFDECWIPDIPGPDNLSGELSQASLSIPQHRIGWLSTLSPKPLDSHFLCTAVLSGPEPQRSRLEAILRRQLGLMNEPTVLVGGNLDSTYQKEQINQLTVFPYLVGEQLNEIMNASRLIIARSGYSTLMDLAVLRQKAVLIPTPGQTEQIYLAERLASKERCRYQTQKEVDLVSAIRQIDDIQPVSGINPPSLLKERVSILLHQFQ